MYKNIALILVFRLFQVPGATLAAAAAAAYAAAYATAFQDEEEDDDDRPIVFEEQFPALHEPPQPGTSQGQSASGRKKGKKAKDGNVDDAILSLVSRVTRRTPPSDDLRALMVEHADHRMAYCHYLGTEARS